MRPVRPDLRSARAVALAAATLAAVPVAAQAADAPLRTIGITPTGARTADQVARAVSADGTEVIQQHYWRVYVRNVAAGTTTLLTEGVRDIVQASNDTKRVLVETDVRLAASDTDDHADLYLIDRANGNTATRVTGGVVNLAPGGTQRNALVDAQKISGNGNVVRYRVSRAIEVAPNDVQWFDESWRYDVATGTNTKTGSDTQVRVQRLDDAGKVLVNGAGIQADGRTWPLPASDGTLDAWIGVDGSSVVFRNGGDPKLTVVNTQTGAARTVTVPAWLVTAGYEVIAPWNAGGDHVLLGTTVTRAAGQLRYVLGRLQVSNGALVQYGPDVTVSTSGTVSAIAPNLAFAATNLHLAQLGGTPLPGAEPSSPTNAKALDYVDFGDATCSNGAFGGRTYTRPWLSLRKGAQGSDLRVPAKADVKVTMVSGAVANAFTLAPGAGRDLNTGRNGGFTYTARVTFTDGSWLDGTKTIPAHETPYCNPFSWF